MTLVHTAVSSRVDSASAARELSDGIAAGLKGGKPDALVVFASATQDYEQLLGELARATGATTIVGASSAGEFTGHARGEGRVSVMAISSSEMQFRVALGEGLAADAGAAARRMVRSFAGLNSTTGHRSALILADALAGHTDELINELTLGTGGSYRFFGGGAGDDGRFQRTHVFAGTRAYTDAAVALEIISSKPLGIGVAHGWTPTGKALRVSEASGFDLLGLDGAPAVEAFRAHAALTGQRFDTNDPLPFFLHNVLGIETEEGHRIRVPLGVRSDGGVQCAAAVPEGAVVHVMRSDAQSATRAARSAATAALEGLGGLPAAGAFVFDCVATRLRLGQQFDEELAACSEVLAPAGFVGCNTYGQIARAEGQFGGFHNCTAVVCTIPQ